MSVAISMERVYRLARERHAAWGVDTEAAIQQALRTPVTLNGMDFVESYEKKILAERNSQESKRRNP